ncbi:MAG: hypothetical protein ACPGUV_03195 [Polyangiales bacterium]
MSFLGYAGRIVHFMPGEGAGFGQDRLPDVVLGPPQGGGRWQGSLDVLSLGVSGSITLELASAAVDGPGPDMLVFENVFELPGTGARFQEPATVAVSQDGVQFVTFPCDLQSATFAGCAGREMTLAHPGQNDLDPRDPAQAGGDAFDLAQVGMNQVRFVRIVDSGLALGPLGANNLGFDLDAVAYRDTAAR